MGGKQEEVDVLGDNKMEHIVTMEIIEDANILIEEDEDVDVGCEESENIDTPWKGAFLESSCFLWFPAFLEIHISPSLVAIRCRHKTWQAILANC